MKKSDSTEKEPRRIYVTLEPEEGITTEDVTKTLKAMTGIKVLIVSDEPCACARSW